jgi:hypothetical protein
MAPAGDLIRTVGDGISGLVVGAIGAIGAGISTIINALEAALPGPLFPIVVIGTIVLLVTWLIRK